MADTFVGVSFVADELLTSTKMNSLAADLENLHNGTALADGLIVTRHLGSSTDLKMPAGNIDFGTISDFNFSTSEQATNQKWVNGDVIYQKSWEGTSSLPGAHGITNLKDVFRIDAMVMASNGQWRPVPWTFNAASYDSTWNGGVAVSSTNLIWQLGTNIGSFTKNRVTLWYSKS